MQLGEARPLTVLVPAAGPAPAERARLERRTRLLAWAGIGWHIVEFAIALAAGVAAGSIALIGFGADSLIEALAGAVVLWLFTGKRRGSSSAERRAQQLIAAQPHPVRTITVDNGTEFHDYAALERATATRFYFATPHHAWERGTNENTNGLLRQYLPKGQSMAHLTQHDCTRIATQLNRRPRKRLGYRTPEECYV